MNSIVIITGASLRTKTGISRVVSEMSKYLNENAIIITDRYVPSASYKISSKTRVIETGSGSLRRFKFKPFVKLVATIVATVFTLHNKHIVLNPHSLTATAAFLSVFLKILFSWRKIQVIAFIYDPEELDYLQTFLSFLFKLILKLGFIDKILVLDNKMAKLVSERFKTHKVHVIRIGVPSSLIELYNKISKGCSYSSKKLYDILISHPRAVKLLFHGILIPRRRVEDLLLALNLIVKDYTDVVLLISGSMEYDPYVSYLLNLRKKLELDRYVYFLGSLSDEELAYAYYTTDIFVFPCDNQTYGLAPLEAMLFRKPVVVSTGSGVSEILDENVALLVPPKDPISLKNSIIRLLSNKYLREKLGANAQEYILSKLTFKHTINDFLKLLKT
jgi:glycosyltransferase involved in cell wall biosynthesis